MSYVAVDADDHLEEGPDGLEFKSFLGTDAPPARSPGHVDRGYITDESRQQRAGASGFWSIEYYQAYFDVDTTTVLHRCISTLLALPLPFPPFSDSPSFLTTLAPNPDLYGPFWVLTTLIFTLYLSSSLGASITSFLSTPDTAFEYDFGLLSTSVALVYAYGLGLPVLLWLGLRWLGVGEWSVVEAVGVWGYAMFVWIPVSILCVIPVAILRWVLVGLAFGTSGAFLVVNVYPILDSAEAKAPRLLIFAIAALHAGLALSFKVLFFSYYIVKGGVVEAPV
ncbi:Yip1-domain-containing protein [Athelia psychrophila]|uniref:Protein YIP n=1 Tax=Athelia psychrophila TaxID=1759441 RepID=A0A166G1W0_9AGAM|nr:Yip1-domain-containing protein [Fibularhizoctonia sp. CBS 109695]